MWRISMACLLLRRPWPMAVCVLASPATWPCSLLLRQVKVVPCDAVELLQDRQPRLAEHERLRATGLMLPVWGLPRGHRSTIAPVAPVCSSRVRQDGAGDGKAPWRAQGCRDFAWCAPSALARTLHEHACCALCDSARGCFSE